MLIVMSYANANHYLIMIQNNKPVQQIHSKESDRKSRSLVNWPTMQQNYIFTVFLFVVLVL